MIKPSLSFLVLAAVVAQSSAKSGGKSMRGRRLEEAMVLDFATSASGDVLTSIGSGVTVSAIKITSGGASVAGQAMVFDSLNPTGNDLDLGSPNEAFGGPGVGGGGASNNVALDNVLIVSEDGDASDPDDNEFGGSLIFDFDPPVQLDQIGLLDSEKAVTLEVTPAAGEVREVMTVAGGDNSHVVAELTGYNFGAVKQLKVTFPDSGAISSLTVSPESDGCKKAPNKFINAGAPFPLKCAKRVGATVAVSSSNTIIGLPAGIPENAFQTHRAGKDFTYDFDHHNYAHGHMYEIKIGFAETFAEFCVAGERVFNVGLNGEALATNLDVFSEAGCNTAYVITTTKMATDQGFLFSFTGVVNDAMFAFIKIEAIPDSDRRQLKTTAECKALEAL